MKRLIFSILSLCTLLPFVSEAQEVVNDSKRRNWSDDEPLYGNVESVRIFTYWASTTDDAVAGTITNDITYRFNDNGDVAEYITKYDQGENRSVYSYSPSRKTQERRFYNDGEFCSRTTFEYNAAGKLIKTTNIDTTGYIEAVCTYRYDKNGRLLEAIYDDMGDAEFGVEIDAETGYRYNSRGQLVMLGYTSDIDAYTEKYEYNTKGQLTRTTYYWADSLSHTIYSSYNDQGQLSVQTYYNNTNQPTYKIVYQYDSMGNMVKQSVVDLHTQTVTTVTQRDIVYR